MTSDQELMKVIKKIPNVFILVRYVLRYEKKGNICKFQMRCSFSLTVVFS